MPNEIPSVKSSAIESTPISPTLEDFRRGRYPISVTPQLARSTPSSTCDQAEENTFSQEFANQLPARSAQRRAQGNFLPANRCPNSSKRLATSAQAMTRSSPTAPQETKSRPWISFTVRSRKGMTPKLKASVSLPSVTLLSVCRSRSPRLRHALFPATHQVFSRAATLQLSGRAIRILWIKSKQETEHLTFGGNSAPGGSTPGTTVKL